MKRSYEFKSESNNINVTIFSVENEDIAWFQLQRKLNLDYEQYDIDIPSLDSFKLKEIAYIQYLILKKSYFFVAHPSQPWYNSPILTQ